ncbi:hypothetical protein F7734_24460 [Scytonema sp. UIC 10036]|uniref:hypothetical protein n=1 Tax=Scytonema sp. UIC 10036 TaxID=2304196 RepID=UPI0012DA7FE8|nr:hypothetical protein [Scytonema sp. UIC 10036]MUG95346.1 hypothetical protein [Scytonema sp. UIC 10036]
MKKLLRQLESIQAIVDTVSPSQIESELESVARDYGLYATSYKPLEQVKTLRDRLIDEIGKGKPVNGYLSADYGYGKTATLIYFWAECRQNKIVAVPPFKFKELGNLMIATYGWIKGSLEKSSPALVPEIEVLYSKYVLKSQQEQAAEIARKFKLSEDKVLKIVRELKTDTTNTDSVLNFWQESVSILRKAGFKGLAIFADECQEFLRTEEGSSVRIQILSDLVKGMRALSSTPVALILGMPTTPTESAIEEQAGDIIHRMREQNVSLRLTDAYKSDFPGKLWDFLCEKFLPEDLSQGKQLVDSATLESLGQLCERRDLGNGPRTIIEVFKRIVIVAQEQQKPYTPLNLIQDYLEGSLQLYGTQQHKLSDAINKAESLISFHKHTKGREAIKLLASFPSGVTTTIAEKFGLLKSLKKLVEDDNLYGSYIIQPTEHSFALAALFQRTSQTVIDKILGSFRRSWLGEWNDAQKEGTATTIFQQEILPLLFPVSQSGQKANWTWRYKDEWKQDRFGFYNFLNGSFERYNLEFPNRSVVISVGGENSGLMRFTPPEETHLDWRFYLSYDQNAAKVPQRLTAIAGTGQVDFHLQLGRSFEREYPTAFGLLRKVMPAEQCSACTLLNLSQYIQNWLSKNPEVSKADRDRLEHHRQECHTLALRLLFPSIAPETWKIIGLEVVKGAETKLIESVFYQKCKTLFSSYQSFYTNLRPALFKYKLALEKVTLSVRRGRQLYQASKEEFENLFDTAGSGLPSLLAIFKQHGLINESKVAGKRTENSQVQFVAHPLESFIQNQLKSKEAVEIVHGQETLNKLNYSEIWKEVKKLGYLQEEFDEALEWLERRRYVEWNRQRGVIRTCVAELDHSDLKGQLNELRTRVSSLLENFDEKLLQEVVCHLNEAETTLSSVTRSPRDFKTTEGIQLTLGQDFDDVKTSHEFANYNDEVVLDGIQRKLQDLSARLERFCREKHYTLQKEFTEIKLKLENLPLRLKTSKVSQEIFGTSGLEDCLNDHRKTLEKQVLQLDKDCQKLANIVVLDEQNIVKLHHQLNECSKFLQTNESIKARLQDLVTGLEQWRIILTSAENLRKSLSNDSEHLVRYDDEFIDRVVEHFSRHGVESFREYELLQKPLVEIEEQIRGERRSRREAFEERLTRYEELLCLISPNKDYLRERCKFDDEDRESSYEALKQIFLEKLLHECDNRISNWKQLERDLYFIARNREKKVTKLLNQVCNLKTQLLSKRDLLLSATLDFKNLEIQVNELKSIFDKGLEFREESIKIESQKDEHLLEEERQLLSAISMVGSGLTISQVYQSLPDNQDIWKLLKTLYKKGYLEITLHQRD